MNTERISVIIPVYNTEKYVEKAVRSVMEQTYPNLEIICVDDGSTDGSAAILHRLQAEDPRIIVVEKENGGMGDARNAGLSRATSEWVTFLDSDDYLEKNAYETVSKAFAENPDMISFGTRIVMESGNSMHVSDLKYYTVNYSGLVNVDEFGILYNMDCSASNKLFRKSILDKYGIRFEKIYYEDFAFTVQYLFCVRTIYFYKDKLYNYLRHCGSIMDQTFNTTPRAIDHLKAVDYIFTFLEEHGMLEAHEKILSKLFNDCYWFAIVYITLDKRQEVVEYARELFRKYGFLHKYYVEKFKNGTNYYEIKKRRHLSTVILQSLLSIKWELFDYKRYKVVRIFNIMVYRKLVTIA